MQIGEHTPSGIPGVGELPWGTHCCHFYDTGSDLADTLVPFFKAGLDANEACVWVTAEPLTAADARVALGAHVHDLAARERSGQIEIVDFRDWYLRMGRQDAATTLQAWVDREQQALGRGLRGLRLTGNMHWLEREDWPAFIDYEVLVNQIFRHHRIVGMCSYCFAKSTARDIVEVVGTHQFALARYGNHWQIVESSTLALARTDLARVQSAADNLRAQDARKDEFMAILSHELRNPLAPIATASQLMRMRGAGDEYTKELSIIDRQVRHLTRLIDDLLDVSRITRGKIDLRLENAELSEVVARAAEMTSHLIEQRGHQLLLDVPSGVIVQIDGDRIVQVIVNLLTNAAKYTPSHGSIKVSLERSEQSVELMISDNGPGIDTALQAHVFELFVQGERALDRREGGLGLGLPIVKSLIELHGGTVNLQSSAATGTSIAIRLPAISPTTAIEKTQAKLDEVRAHGKVLVVDDNEDAAEMLAEALQRFGYDVQMAHEGTTALQLTTAFVPDIAILDIGLPNMDGFELAVRLRKVAGLQDIKLVALSGYSGDVDRKRARSSGFAEHLAKPVELTKLLATITTLLGPADPHA